MDYDVLIIGAGAAGLMAARDLSKSGYHVGIFEASERAGGRIATSQLWPGGIVETGAEFIHGGAPVTHSLIKEAGLNTVEVKGKIASVRNGIWMNEDHQQTNFSLLQKAFSQLTHDCTIRVFLDTCFPEGEYDELRKTVTMFAEGFSLADVNYASALSLRSEWAKQEEEQYRLPGGYGLLIRYLVDECTQNGVEIFYSSVAHRIEWNQDIPAVFSSQGNYTGKKIIITVPAGVMQSGAIKFDPSPDEYLNAFENIGFGTVIKILLNFRTAFWTEKYPDLSFILSDEVIPTWWTQFPVESSTLLTGWLGGPAAASYNVNEQERLLEKSFESLSNIFQKPVAALKKELRNHKTVLWHQNIFTQGGYSYNLPQSDSSRRLLNTPLGGTVYFGGEALYSGDAVGTVEAALASGQTIAAEIKRSLQS